MALRRLRCNELHAIHENSVGDGLAWCLWSANQRLRADKTLTQDGAARVFVSVRSVREVVRASNPGDIIATAAGRGLRSVAHRPSS